MVDHPEKPKYLILMSYFGLFSSEKRALLFAFLAMAQQQQPSLYYNFQNDLCSLLWSGVSLFVWPDQYFYCSYMYAGKCQTKPHRGGEYWLFWKPYVVSNHSIYLTDNTTTTTMADELKDEFRQILVFSVHLLCFSLPVVHHISSVTTPGSRDDVWDDKR